MVRLPYGLLVVLVMLAGACAGQQRPEQSAEAHIRTFHDHMRWGRWEAAATYIDESQRFDFLVEHEGWGDDYHVTDYEIASVALGASGKEALVSVRVQSYRLPQTRIIDRRITERWIYHEGLRLWQRVEARERELGRDAPGELDDRRQRRPTDEEEPFPARPR